MRCIWSYIMMALCVSVTSAGVINFYGNVENFHGNEAAGVEEEKLWTPPSGNGLNIDPSRLPGNSNGETEQEINCLEICKNNESGDSCLCDLPTFVSETLEALLNPNNESNEYKMVPFDKEDIINLKSSELCRSLCDSGIEKPPCKCSY